MASPTAQDMSSATKKISKYLVDLNQETKVQSRSYLSFNNIDVKVETQAKEVVHRKMYFTDESEDFTYQYKYLKLYDEEIADNIFKFLAIRGGQSLHLDDQKLKQLIKNILLVVDSRSRDSEGSGRAIQDQGNPKKVEKQTLSQKFAEYKLTLGKGWPMEDIGMFWPNFKVIKEDFDKDKLKEWLENEGSNFYGKNYALAMLEINPADSVDAKLTNENLRNGRRNCEVECIYLCLYYLFHKIRVTEQDVSGKNVAKFDKAYNLLAEAFLFSGLIHFKSTSATGMPILKFFYTLLDCFPSFKAHCCKRINNAINFMSANGQGRSVFKAELKLLEDDTLVKDLVMILIMEFDITSEEFLYSLNLLEYLCDSNSSFSYLGLFLGDFYDMPLMGASRKADYDKRLNFYRTADKAAYKCPIESRERDVQLNKILSANVKIRLSVMRQQKLGELFAEIETGKPARGFKNEALVRYYKSSYDLNEGLLAFAHPIGLMFMAEHFIKSNQYKLNPELAVMNPELDKASFFLLERGKSLTLAAQFLSFLFLLGDTDNNMLYYLVLRQLRLEDVILPAMRVVDDTRDDELYAHLAYCKEQGIGGSVDYEFALASYHQAIIQHIEAGNPCLVGKQLYRIGLMMLRGGDRKLSEKYFLMGIASMLQSSSSELNVDKSLLFHVADSLLKLPSEEMQDLGKTLLKEAYDLYPFHAADYLLHYEIELKLAEESEEYTSKTKKSLNTAEEKFKITSTFSEECKSRKQNQSIKDNTHLLLSKLREKIIDKMLNEYSIIAHDLKLDQFRYDINDEDFIKGLETLEKKGLFCQNVDWSNLRIPASALSTTPSEYIEKKFKQIKKAKKEMDDGKAASRTAQHQTKLMVLDLAKNNPDIVLVKPTEVESITTDITVKAKTDLTEPCLAFGTYRFIDNNQRTTRITLQYNDYKSAKNFCDNIDYFLTYNPFLLNYYGMSSDESAVGNKSKWTIYLYAEYFETLASSNGSAGILEGKKLPLDKMFKIAYQLTLAIRSLHVLGKVSYYISSHFIALTPNYDVHLIVPFFEDYFKDPLLYVLKCEANSNFMKYSHLAPECFGSPKDSEDIDGKFETKHKVTPMSKLLRTTFFATLAQRSEDFPLMQNYEQSRMFSFCAASDIWSLGVFFFQLFSSKPFYEERLFKDGQDFVSFMRNPGKVKSHVDRKLGQLPPELPKSFLRTLKLMLRFNPLRRPTIETALSSFEQIAFNQLYNIQPATPKEMSRMFFQNAYLDKSLEVGLRSFQETTHEQEITVRLPKGLVFRGNAVRGIPRGEGEITHKGVRLLKAQFNEGVIEGKATFKIGAQDFLEFTNIQSSVPCDPPEDKRDESPFKKKLAVIKEKKHGKTKIEERVPAKIVYDELTAIKSSVNVTKFVDKTWIPDVDIFKEKFKKYRQFDETALIRKKRKEMHRAHHSKPRSPRHKNTDTVPGVSTTLAKVIAKQIQYWIDDLDRKNEDLGILTMNKEKKKKENNQNIDDYRARDAQNSKGEIVVPQEEPTIKALEEMPSSELKSELEDLLNFAILANKSFDFSKKETYDERTDMEKLAKDLQNLEFDEEKQAERIKEMSNSVFKGKFMTTIQEIQEPFNVTEHHTMVVDAFGDCLRIFFNRDTSKFDYSRGISVSHLELSRMYHTAVYSASSSPTHVFISRVANFALCDLACMPQSLRSFISTLNRAKYDYAIITELKGIQFRGRVSERGAEEGHLIIAEEMQQIEYCRGESSSYRGMIVDMQNDTKYEGNIVGTKKQGFGKLKHKDKLVYEGYFKDGKPHGKGLFFGNNKKVIFKGIFKDGTKKFGTSFVYYEDYYTRMDTVSAQLVSRDSRDENENKAEIHLYPSRQKDDGIENNIIEINGIYHAIKVRAKTESESPLLAFVNQMQSSSGDSYLTEGSIRVKHHYPIFFTTFVGQDFNFQKPVQVKIIHEDGAHFFGSFCNGKKHGLGMMVDSSGGKMGGFWDDNLLTGYYESDCGVFDTYRGKATKVIRNGQFIVQAPGKFKQYGLGTIEYLDSTFYKGEIVDNLPSGYGYRIEENGDTYSGEFKDGSYEGYGLLECPSKACTYEGFFVHNKMNKYGIYRYQGIVYRGFWENHLMKAMFCDDEIRHMNGFSVHRLVSEVEYNNFEATYSKKGVCRTELLKLVRPDYSEQQIVADILSLVMQVLLLGKYKHKEVMKLAFFVIESMTNSLLGLSEPKLFSRRLMTLEQQIDELQFEEVVEQSFHNIVACKENQSLKVEVDLSRDTLKSLDQKFKISKETVKKLVLKVVSRVREALIHEEKELLGYIRKILSSDFMDYRRTSEHGKLRETFKRELYALAYPAVSELGKLLEKQDISDKDKRDRSKSPNFGQEKTDKKDSSFANSMQNSLSEIANAPSFSAKIGKAAADKSPLVVPTVRQNSLGDKSSKLLASALLQQKAVNTNLKAYVSVKNDLPQRNAKQRLQDLTGKVDQDERRKENSMAKLPPIASTALLPVNSNELVPSRSLISRQNTQRSNQEEIADWNWHDIKDTWLEVLWIFRKSIREVDAKIPDLYEGEIFNDEINGFGSIIAKGHVIYEGEFKENQPSGLGKMLMITDWNAFPELSRINVFQGMVERGLPNGLGFLKSKDNLWKGKFVDGKRDGLFVCTKKDKINFSGYFERGINEGFAIKMNANGQSSALMNYSNGIVLAYHVIL